MTKRVIGESTYDERNGWIDGYINKWLADPSKEHISVLGEFGTGKTWFALHYAWVALRQYRDTKQKGLQRSRVPLFIPLRDYARAVSVESLFSEFFFRKHEIKIPNYSAFEQLNRMGKLLLIFDGFDEMAARIDRQQMINNFWELARAVTLGAKAILTSRTEHFPDAQEGRSLLRAELQASTTRLTGQPPQFEILEILKLDDVQVREVLKRRAPGSATIDRIMRRPELVDLARRPVMAELIIEALPDIQEGKRVDLSRIYLYAVRQKLERDVKAERTFTSLADKVYFLCELSWEMLSTNHMSLNYRLFPERIRRLFGPAVREQKELDHWHYDMMGQTMLIRNQHGDYAPAHRSLLEFFVAFKIAGELGIIADDFVEIVRAQSHVDAHLPARDYRWREYFKRDISSAGIVRRLAPLRSFLQEPADYLMTTFGSMPLSLAVTDLLGPMLNVDGKNILRSLLGTKGGGERGFTGGNCVTLLIRGNRDALLQTDLDRTVIKGANLSNARLNGASLRVADLRGAVLQSTDLSGVDLRGADLRNVEFRGAILKNADMRNANLTGAMFRELGQVKSISFSPDGSLLASGGDNAGVRLWDVRTGTERESLGGHLEPVHRVAFDRRSQILATMSDDRIQLWTLPHFTLLKTITRDELSLSSLRALAFSPVHPGQLAVGGYGGVVLVSTSDGACIPIRAVKENVHVLEYEREGGRLIVGLDKSFVVLIDTFIQGDIATYKGMSARCVDLAYSGNRVAAVVSGAGDSDHLIGISQPGPDWQKFIWLKTAWGAFPWCTRAVFFGGGAFLAYGDQDSRMNIYHCDSGKVVTELDYRGGVASLAVSPDGMLLASGSAASEITFWDLRLFVTSVGEPRIDMIDFVNPPRVDITDYRETWPAWWHRCEVDVPTGMVPNPGFGKQFRRIAQRLDCVGLRIYGAKGLEPDVSGVITGSSESAVATGNSIRQWLISRGATN